MDNHFSFPIGDYLTNFMIIQTASLNNQEYCISLAVLKFSSTQYLFLETLASSEEISISHLLSYERRHVLRALSKTLSPPAWSQAFIGQQLKAVEVRESNYSQRHQIIFAFDKLDTVLSFQAKGTVLEVVFYERAISA